MKIIQASAGLLTNFEVLDFLRNKSEPTIEEEKLDEAKNDGSEVGEDDQSVRIKQNLTPSETKVYEYLVETAARDQTRECVTEFLQRCKKYEFTQADILPILNIRPSSSSATVELYSLMESLFDRYENQVDEIIQMIEEVLPPCPIAKKDNVEEEELAPMELSASADENAAKEPQIPTPPPEPMTEA